MSNKFKLIGFDLDGTLVNSLPDLALSLNQAFAEFDLPQAPEEAVMTWIGKGADILFGLGLEWTGKAESFTEEQKAQIKARFDHYYGVNVCNASRLFPNVKETLEKLKEKGYTLAVITNKPTVHVEPVLKAFGINDLFSARLGGQSLPLVKPNPQPMYYLFGKFGVFPEEMLFVGDSQNDILAAQAAGCKSVGLTYGYNYNVPISESNPDYVCDDFADVLKIVEESEESEESEK